MSELYDRSLIRMIKSNLKEMVRGWFVGDFAPSCYVTQDVEVGIKHYAKGEYEKAHYHKIATEITVIVSGSVKMNDTVYKTNEIITIEPGESTDFFALEDTTTVIVKLPGATNDKYLEE